MSPHRGGEVPSMLFVRTTDDKVTGRVFVFDSFFVVRAAKA